MEDAAREQSAEATGGLNDVKMTAPWCANVLRRVAPRLWLCRSLIDQVNRVMLEKVAQVGEAGSVYRPAVRPGRLTNWSWPSHPFSWSKAREYRSCNTKRPRVEHSNIGRRIDLLGSIVGLA